MDTVDEIFFPQIKSKEVNYSEDIDTVLNDVILGFRIWDEFRCIVFTENKLL